MREVKVKGSTRFSPKLDLTLIVLLLKFSILDFLILATFQSKARGRDWLQDSECDTSIAVVDVALGHGLVVALAVLGEPLGSRVSGGFSNPKDSVIIQIIS